jgi:hypothetical protein
MVLVPEDVLSRYERKQKIETSPLVTGMMRQDADMSGILESENLTDVEKQKLYNARMEDYLSLRKQKDDQIPAVRVTRDGEAKGEPLRDEDVVAHLPATLRPKAVALLKRLRADPGVISWNESGRVKVDGTEIANSNISELVSDAARTRKSFHPTGAWRFFQGLAKLNVPRDIAGNNKRWEELGERGPSNSGTPPLPAPERETPEDRTRRVRQYVRERLNTPVRGNWINY